MRRVPQQARSQRRIETILDAASAVIGEIGFDAATTNMFAERANTSIGSVYQFFENKDAIIAALCDRHTSELEPMLQDAQLREATCEEQMSSMLNVLADYYFENVGFRALMYGTYAPADMSVINEHLHRPIIARLAKTVQQFLHGNSEFESRLHAEVMFYAFARILYHVAQMERSVQQGEWLERQKRLLMGICQTMLQAV